MIVLQVLLWREHETNCMILNICQFGILRHCIFMSDCIVVICFIFAGSQYTKLVHVYYQFISCFRHNRLCKTSKYYLYTYKPHILLHKILFKLDRFELEEYLWTYAMWPIITKSASIWIFVFCLLFNIILIITYSNLRSKAVIFHC